MASGDRRVGDLPAAQVITDDDLFVLEQNDEPKSLSGAVLTRVLLDRLEAHGGIVSWTYASSVGLVDNYVIKFADGSTQILSITNGAKGDPGEPGRLWIKYANKMPTEASHSMGDIPDNYIGICPGNQTSAPLDWRQYTWYQWKGNQGDQGDRGARGFSIFSADIGSQGTHDTEVVPSLIETHGETLQIGDMLLAPSGNLYKVTSLPTANRYLVGAQYLTSLLGPKGETRVGGKRIYDTSTEPPEEMTDRIYKFKLEDVNTRGDNPVAGDYLIDRNNNVFTINEISEAGDIRANWIATWFKEQDALELPEYFDYLVLKSSSPNSVKKFKLTVDDSGEMSIEEVTKTGTFTTEDTYGWGGYVGTLNFAVGMTWQQFVESAYNTKGFVIQNGRINDPSGCYLFRRAGSANYYQTPENKIIDGQVYEWDF